MYCLIFSLLELKNASQTSIISTKWRYLWTHSTDLDFDSKVMCPEDFATFEEIQEYETAGNYFAWINQVVDMHRGPSIDKFRLHSCYVPSYDAQIKKWVKFALSKRVKDLVLDFIGHGKFEGGYPFGFHLLRYPPSCSGIIALQSLHLNYVDVRGEFIEFLLSHWPHLERLCLDTIPLSNLKVKTSKLKYLTIIMRFHDLKQLEIDAENLLYFKYDDGNHEGGPHFVFKSVPMLAEISFRGGFCRYPSYPIFEKLSRFTNQLCKLSFMIDTICIQHHVVGVVNIPNGVIPNFPNVKHFTCATDCYENSCVLSLKRFIETCPMLEEFMLQVTYCMHYLSRESGPEPSREASELQEIDLEDEEKNDEETKKDFNYDYTLETGRVSEFGMENANEEPQSHPNLRILKLVSFLGVSCDVKFALTVVSYACALKAIICDPRGVSGDAEFFFIDHPDEYDAAKLRARKLAKIVSPKVNVVIL